MDPATVGLIVNGTISLIQAIPSIITLIKEMDAPQEEKDGLIARIRQAQESLPVWE